MAMIETVRPAPFGAITAYRVVGQPISRFMDWINARVDAAKTARALSKLTPAMLDDIGLTEADVLRYRRDASLFWG